jgi:hypothetical protein
MRTFKGFNSSNGDVCPVCHTSKDIETVLIPLPWTEDDGICEAKQMHKMCYDLIEFMTKKDSSRH